jgi:hypothetical protein
VEQRREPMNTNGIRGRQCSGELASGSEALIHQGHSVYSCASIGGPNRPRKGIKGALSTQRNSTTDKRQKSQYRLAFPRGE